MVDFDYFSSHALSIPGWFGPMEATAIAKVARACRPCPHPGTYLEVGTGCGRSAAMMAEALPGWQIHTVDAYAVDVKILRRRHPGALDCTSAHDYAAMALGPYGARVTRHVTNSAQAAHDWIPPRRCLDVLLIDGVHAHTVEDVEIDMLSWLPLLDCVDREAPIFLRDVGDAALGFARAMETAGVRQQYVWRRERAAEVGTLMCLKIRRK